MVLLVSNEKFVSFLVKTLTMNVPNFFTPGFLHFAAYFAGLRQYDILVSNEILTPTESKVYCLCRGFKKNDESDFIARLTKLAMGHQCDSNASFF
jgi:hypothetical protein